MITLGTLLGADVSGNLETLVGSDYVRTVDDVS